MNRQKTRNQKPLDKRAILYSRANGKCERCGREVQNKNSRAINSYMTIDHIVPKSKGGTNNIENLQCLCRACNLAKANNTRNVSSYLDDTFHWRAKDNKK